MYPPSQTEQETLSRASTTKEYASQDELLSQDNSGVPLDSSSLPVRVVYSPAVSRSGSVTHTDQPSILLSHHESGDDTQIIPLESLQSGSRIRSNSFEARAPLDGTMHRRNLLRNNSSDSHNHQTTLSVESAIPVAQTTILGSNNRQRRLTIEEVAEESEDPDYSGNASVFTAFPQSRWFNSTTVAKVVLVIVSTSVVVNIVYA